MLGAGQLDAGFAALAGFIASVLAVRYLSPDELGAYALLYLAFGVATQVPTQLVFSPAEVLIVHRTLAQRVPSLRWSLPKGALISGASSLTVAAGALPVAGDFAPRQLLPLIVTAVAFAFISPIQDHMRRVFHASELSSRASTLSLINLVATGLSAIALIQVDVLWMPFGSMTAGNVASVLVGLFLLRNRGHSPSPGTRELISIGRYLLVVGLANSGGRYVAGTFVGWIAGPAALGFAEAAHVLGRPAEVASNGVLAVVGPRVMVAQAAEDRAEVRRLSRLYYGVVISVSITYTALVVTPIGGGLAESFFPTAYEVPGLVLVTQIGLLAVALVGPLLSRLMSLRREISLARYEVEAQVGRLLASLSAGWIGAFAIPLGNVISGFFKVLRYRLKLRHI